MSDAVKYAVVIYFLIINIIAFAAMGRDKHNARINSRRIRERTLLLLTATGGALGSLLGMMIFHHKTKQKKFTVLVPFLLLCNIAVFAYIQFILLYPADSFISF